MCQAKGESLLTAALPARPHDSSRKEGLVNKGGRDGVGQERSHAFENSRQCQETSTPGLQGSVKDLSCAVETSAMISDEQDLPTVKCPETVLCDTQTWQDPEMENFVKAPFKMRTDTGNSSRKPLFTRPGKGSRPKLTGRKRGPAPQKPANDSWWVWCPSKHQQASVALQGSCSRN